MSDDLTVSRMALDDSKLAIEDPLTERLPLFTHTQRDHGVAVTNTKPGEPDEDARTYLVQRLRVACDPSAVGVGDDAVSVWSCGCKGFKYHRLPDMGDLDAQDDALRDALQAVGTCKHIDAARVAARDEPDRAADQGGLGDFEVPDL